MLCFWVFPQICYCFLVAPWCECQCLAGMLVCPSVSDSSSWSHLVSVLNRQCLPSLRSLGCGGCVGLYCPLVVYRASRGSQMDKNHSRKQTCVSVELTSFRCVYRFPSIYKSNPNSCLSWDLIPGRWRFLAPDTSPLLYSTTRGIHVGLHLWTDTARAASFSQVIRNVFKWSSSGFISVFSSWLNGIYVCNRCLLFSQDFFAQVQLRRRLRWVSSNPETRRCSTFCRLWLMLERPYITPPISVLKQTPNL